MTDDLKIQQFLPTNVSQSKEVKRRNSITGYNKTLIAFLHITRPFEYPMRFIVSYSINASCVVSADLFNICVI